MSNNDEEFTNSNGAKKTDPGENGSGPSRFGFGPNDDIRSSAPEVTLWEFARSRFAEFFPLPRVPLVGGGPVGISSQLIAQVEAALEIDLPSCLPDEAIIEPSADTLSDEEVKLHVRKDLLRMPAVAQVMATSRMLDEACLVRSFQLTRQSDTQLELRESMPLKVSRSQSNQSSKLGILTDPFKVWWSSSGIACAASAAVLVLAMLVDLCFQVSTLKEGDWSVTQKVFGAIGFTWAFTVGAVATTQWWLGVRKDPKIDPAEVAMARSAMLFTWCGLAGLGYLLGSVQPIEAGEGVLESFFRNGMIVVAVFTLALLCVSFERRLERFFKAACDRIQVENDQIGPKENEITCLDTKVISVQQLRTLAVAARRRVRRHIHKQVRLWLSKRDEYRERNQRLRNIEALELQSNQTELKLASLRRSGAA